MDTDWLAWYTALASEPGWKFYVWRRVNNMARECPAMWSELPAELTAAMKAKEPADAQSGPR